MNHKQSHAKNIKPEYIDSYVDIKDEDEKENNEPIVEEITELTQINNSTDKHTKHVDYGIAYYSCLNFKKLLIICCIILSFVSILLLYTLCNFWYKKFYPGPLKGCEPIADPFMKSFECLRFN